MPKSIGIPASISESGWFNIKKRWGIGKNSKGPKINKEFDKSLPWPPKEKSEEITIPIRIIPLNLKRYLIDYWRDRAANKNTSTSESVLMKLTADALEG